MLRGELTATQRERRWRFPYSVHSGRRRTGLENSLPVADVTSELSSSYVVMDSCRRVRRCARLTSDGVPFREAGTPVVSSRSQSSRPDARDRCVGGSTAASLEEKAQACEEDSGSRKAAGRREDPDVPQCTSTVRAASHSGRLRNQETRRAGSNRSSPLRASALRPDRRRSSQIING